MSVCYFDKCITLIARINSSLCQRVFKPPANDPQQDSRVIDDHPRLFWLASYQEPKTPIRFTSKSPHATSEERLNYCNPNTKRDTPRLVQGGSINDHWGESGDSAFINLLQVFVPPPDSVELDGREKKKENAEAHLNSEYLRGCHSTGSSCDTLRRKMAQAVHVHTIITTVYCLLIFLNVPK